GIEEKTWTADNDPTRVSQEGAFESGERTPTGGHLENWDRNKWMSPEAIGNITVKDGKIVSVQVLSDDGGTDHGQETKEQNGNDVANPFEKRHFWGGDYVVSAY